MLIIFTVMFITINNILSQWRVKDVIRFSIMIVGILVIFISIVVLYYNKFYSIKNMIENAIKALNVYFTRRHGLIPELIEILKPFYPEDALMFDELTNLKNSSISSSTFTEKVKMSYF